jgi:hypothetical protein
VVAVAAAIMVKVMVMVGHGPLPLSNLQSPIPIGNGIDSSIWREEIQNRNRLLDLRFGGKKFKIEIDSSIWREEIQNRNRLVNLAGRNRQYFHLSTKTMTMMWNLSVVTPAIASILLLLNHNPAIGFRLPSSTSITSTACAAARQRQCPPHHVLHEHGFGVGDTDAVGGSDDAIAVDTSSLSRRFLIRQGISFTMAASSSSLPGFPSSVASAKVVESPIVTTTSTSMTTSPEREALLKAISNKSSDTIILQAIENLIPRSPLKGTSNTDKLAYASALDGTWKLLWYNKSDFSPLLKLPVLRPTSYQYFGSIAEQEVGTGRVAQGLVGGVVSLLGGSDTEVWLSSGALAKTDNPSILEIYPPFRFQLGKVPGATSGDGEKRTIVESQSDAEFRAANARSIEAQLAPKNEYEQLYLEDFGTGSLRVSVIAKGDPVIVGDMFVHQKL